MPGAQRLVIALTVGASAACAPKPFVLDGNADYARITYAGDTQAAAAAAQRHCAQFEREPRLQAIEESVALFYCVRP
jgi:hypothetical protein